MHKAPVMDQQIAQKLIDDLWTDSIVPELVEYIKIPAKSPHFDSDWDEHGYIEQAIVQIFGWCQAQDVRGIELEIVRLEIKNIVHFYKPSNLYNHWD